MLHIFFCMMSIVTFGTWRKCWCWHRRVFHLRTLRLACEVKCCSAQALCYGAYFSSRAEPLVLAICQICPKRRSETGSSIWGHSGCATLLCRPVKRMSWAEQTIMALRTAQNEHEMFVGFFHTNLTCVTSVSCVHLKCEWMNIEI